MTSINDEQLDAKLRTFLHAEAEGVAARAADSSSALVAVRRRLARGHAPRRPILLLVAALLISGAASIGLAVGSGVLRQRASLPEGIWGGGSCPRQEMEPGLVVQAGWRNDVGGWTSHDVTNLGEVLTRVGTATDSGTVSMQRLSPNGVDLVRQAVLAARAGGGCASVLTDEPYHSVLIEADGGLVGLEWGRDASNLRRPDPNERSVAIALGAKLADLAAWLPSEAWLDPVEQPYRIDPRNAAIESSSPAATVGPMVLGGRGPCAYVPDAAISSMLHISGGGEEHISGLPVPDVRSCIYGFQTGTMTGFVDARLVATSADEARGFVDAMFGRVAAERADDGWTLYANGCHGPATTCGPSVAVAKEPYFVTIMTPQETDDLVARRLASLMISNVAALESP